MIKTWVNKALILAYITLFCFLGISTKVNAERLFILDNLINNGNFINTSGWGTTYATITASNNILTINDNQGYGSIYQGSSYVVTYHKYYISYSIYPVNYSSSVNMVSFGGLIINKSIISNIWNDISFILEPYTDGGALVMYPHYTNRVYQTYLKNFMIFDLTKIFGYGYEPSLQDFELYYLPDLDYFDTYNSFEPDMITSITDANYTNLQENLTGIDYTKSIIDNDGKNIDLDLSLYFYDTVVNGTTVTGIYTAQDYVNTNHPTMKYNNEIYTLNWVFSDYSERVIILDLTDEQELILKKILFNRYIDRDNEYFNFKAETGFFSYAKMWFTIGSKFDLLVDVKSFLLSRETVTQNDFNIINEMYIKTYDTDDNLLLPSLKMNIADTFRTVYVDDFGSQYTNISKFNFEFLITSPDTDDDYTEEEHYFYEIGIFSSDKVLHPSFIESDIESLWDMKTCDWYQIGCHLSNFANEILTTTYNKLNIDAIIAFFDGIIDDVTQVVDTAPSGVKTVFAVLFTGLGVALIIVIIEKMNR